MITNHPQLLEAIAERKKVRVRFYSVADDGVIDRTCAPLDYGPGAGPADGLNRYWLWNYAGPDGARTLGLKPGQIVELQVLGEEFQPGEFGAVPWVWAVRREWGQPTQTMTNR